MEIRKLKREDIPACVQIFEIIAPGEGWGDESGRLRSELEAMFAIEQFIVPEFFVCEVDGAIVGFAGYSNTGFDDGVFGLFWANVHPDFQGQGIGKALTEVRIDAIKKIEKGVILSTTRKTWHLERFGFKVLYERGDGYFLMSLDLKQVV